ncbi:YeeE/YedE thiosulfate transporter family protein [Rhodoplanes azumiensis]|uniref:YeeE/YedE thiosulfate transporter family protein n=1 Tax=Rhodoplanes azumiensis TaxID=1897628 RepID=A0ABW5AFK2_9BRAD
MSLFVAVPIGLAMGVVFGFLLEKGRVFEPGIIVGQMQLRSFVMLKMFLAAVATGAVVLAALNGLGIVKLQPKAALYAADVVGGLILGIGIALAGACPGTTLAQIGAGYRDAIFTLIGGLAGAVTFSYAEPWLKTTFLGQGQGKITFADLLGVPYWSGALGLAATLIAVLIGLELWRPWRAEIGRNADGDLDVPADRPARPRIVPAE